ncbi:MAG TPA: membrane dipeptidase [Allosphingosinicella sp.]|jgi:membrane dipeptidase
MDRREMLAGGAATLALIGTQGRVAPVGAPARPVPTVDTLTVEGPGFDAPAMLAAGLDAAVIDLRIYPRGPAEAAAALREWNEAEERALARFRLVRRAADFASAAAAGRFAVVLACQDAAILGPSVYSVEDRNLEILREHHRMGLRVLQLTHNERNSIGDGFRERTDAGLSLLGEAVVAEMARLGMVVDLSHCSDMTTLAAIRLSPRPVAVTHAGCRALHPSRRNKPDEAIRALADKGGYFGIYMMTRWLTEKPTASVDTVVDHIEHAIRIGGAGLVGFGSDQPLAGEPAPQAEKVAALAAYQARNRGLPGAEPLNGHVTAADLDRPDRMAVLESALRRRGHKSAAIEGILGGNFARLFASVAG